MNLIEALKLADGKPVTRKSWNCDSCFTFAENGQIIWGRSCAPVCLRKDDFFSDDWYVVEPKSKIEEAIERGYLYALNSITTFLCNSDKDAIKRAIKRAMLRVANEAIQIAANVCVEDKALFLSEKIRTLKVKE